ncbi:MAG: hypothetical protein ACOC7L_01705 [Acidobacteriota bacterium]
MIRFPHSAARLWLLAPLALLLGLAPGSAPAAHADERNALTPAQVSCNRAQLHALLERVEVETAGGPASRAQSVFVTYANRSGFYEGLVVGTPWTREVRAFAAPEEPVPEVHLAFHLNPDVRTLLLNPERIPLDQLSLTRETSTSNLVPPGDGLATVLRLDPTLSPSPGGPGDLVIDNLDGAPPDGPGPRAADTKPGRGLTEAGLTDLCHGRLTGLDRRVFSILQRTVRVELADLQRSLRYDTRIAILRAEEPEEYLADVYLVDPESGELYPEPLELRIEASLDSEGRLAAGRIEAGMVPTPGTAQAEGAVHAVRPVFPGVEAGYETLATVQVTSDPEATPGVPPVAGFDWRDVLSETAWKPARPAPKECGLGTAAEIAATPRADENLELLALALSPGVTAEQEIYDRLVRDVTAIRELEPAEGVSLENVPFLAFHTGRTLILTVDGLETFRAMEEDEYDAWDCLNDWYGFEGAEFDAASPAEHPWVLVRLKGLYALDLVAAEYEALPGVVSAQPERIDRPAIGFLPSLCASVDGATYRYFFDHPQGSALLYHYRVTADGEVELVGVHDQQSAAPPPPWLSLREECYQGLRQGS